MPSRQAWEAMSRKGSIKTVHLGDGLPPGHLARFIVDSVALLDLSALSAHDGSRGGAPSAPEVWLGLLLSGAARGGFSTRTRERATAEAVLFRVLAGHLHPDHETLATFRCTCFPERKKLFVPVLVLAQEAGVLKVGTVCQEGTRIPADTPHARQAVRDRRLEWEAQRRTEVEERFLWSEQSDSQRRPVGSW